MKSRSFARAKGLVCQGPARAKFYKTQRARQARRWVGQQLRAGVEDLPPRAKFDRAGNDARAIA
jgi:hypothetical protein